MENKKGVFAWLKRKSALLLIVALLLPLYSAHTDAAGIQKTAAKRSIAIAYDNSGSMYGDYQGHYAMDTWCQAVYAAEVFAAMLNESDTLLFYPMHDVLIGGQRYSRSSPFVMTGPNQAQSFETMMSQAGSGTPFVR